MNFRLIFRILSSLLCTSGLLLQSCQLLSEYLSGKTVVNIEVRRESRANLPAITVCFPGIASMERAANYSQEYHGDFQRYKDILELIKRNESLYDIYKSNMNILYKHFQPLNMY